MKIKDEGGFNRIQINVIKESTGKSSVMINIREDDPEIAVELYKQTQEALKKLKEESK